jgi:hypothetical protein
MRSAGIIHNFFSGGGHPLRLPFSATAMIGCSMNIRVPRRDGTMVNGALRAFVAASTTYEQ